MNKQNNDNENELEIILASYSRARRDLLKKIGFKFKAVSTNVREKIFKDPIRSVLENSKLKALKACEMGYRGIIIGVDTVVYIDDIILGKPRDIDEAFKYLKMLSGREHKVYSGITIYNTHSGKIVQDYEETIVHFRELSDEEIKWYITTGEPLEKAGGYSIQGYASIFIDYIKGCYYNVVGLPLVKLFKLLSEVGINPYRHIEIQHKTPSI